MPSFCHGIGKNSTFVCTFHLIFFKVDVITDQQREGHLGEDNLHERNEEVILEFEVDEVPGCQQVLDKASQRLYSHCMNFSMLDFDNCFYTCVCV